MNAGTSEIVVYETDCAMRLEVRLVNNTVWLSQKQMAELFGCSSDNVGLHLKHIFSEAELEESATTEDFSVVRQEGSRQVTRRVRMYNLEVVISVGFRVNSRLGIQFRRWANTIIQDHLLRGYSINTRLNYFEDKIDRRLSQAEQEVATLKKKVDYFVQTQQPPLAQIFYQGQFWDAKSLLIKFIRRAKKELVVIDAYVGVATLDMLAKRNRGVKIELITHSNGELADSDYTAIARQYGNFTKTLCGICHDRFIIVDQKEIFLIGASLKDAGRLTFAAARMGPEVIPGLLASIHAAAVPRS